jgi:hypothetical protein
MPCRESPNKRSGRAPVLLAFGLALIGAAAPAASDEWRLVLPGPGEPFEHPPLRALGLGARRPEDVIETASYRGTRRRYAQLRYGSPSSVRITVVLDEAAPGAADLYVDADRNRRIEARDLVRGEGRTWRLPLDVAIVAGEATRFERRAAVFRLGATGLTLGYAAAGSLDGRVRLGDREHAARRQDGDGNGLLTDAQDLLWIDLDDDGRWDATAEQFLYAGILPIGAARYAVRSDPLGTRLALTPLEGTGTVRLVAVRPASRARVAALEATLIGQDGSAIGLTDDGAEATVPVGAYRLGTVTLSLDDPAGGPRWSYVFSDNDRRGEPRWYQVEKGGQVEIDPIGTLELVAGLVGGEKPRRAGEDLELQPRLYTGDGLLIVTSYRGTPTTPSSDEGPGAKVALRTTDGRPLALGHSGFA